MASWLLNRSGPAAYFQARPWIGSWLPGFQINPPGRTSALSTGLFRLASVSTAFHFLLHGAPSAVDRALLEHGGETGIREPALRRRSETLRRRRRLGFSAQRLVLPALGSAAPRFEAGHAPPRRRLRHRTR